MCHNHIKPLGEKKTLEDLKDSQTFRYTLVELSPLSIIGLIHHVRRKGLFNLRPLMTPCNLIMWATIQEEHSELGREGKKPNGRYEASPACQDRVVLRNDPHPNSLSNCYHVGARVCVWVGTQFSNCILNSLNTERIRATASPAYKWR